MKKTIAFLGLVLISSTSFAGDLNKKGCPDQGDVQRILLEAAALDKLQEVIKLRSCPGADINASWSTSKGTGTAIALAVSNKASRVTKYLLKDPTVEINKGEVIFDDDRGDQIFPTLEKVFDQIGWGLSDSDLEKIVLAFNMRADFDPNLHYITSYGVGKAPLLRAAESGLIKTFKALLENPKTNINVTRVNGNIEEGHGVIYYAAYLNSMKACEIIESALNKNIDLNKTDADGNRNSRELYQEVRSWPTSPFRNCKIKLLKQIILDSSYNINQQNTVGWTDLMLVSSYGADELVSVMLTRTDININLCSKDGKSALDIAVENNKANTIKILKSYGAKSCLP